MEVMVFNSGVATYLMSDEGGLMVESAMEDEFGS